jgi:acyl-CoA synthetase (NDP forming)
MKVDFVKLDRAFNPRVVAVVGDSKVSNFDWLRGQNEFKGKLYSVHVNPDTFEDIKALGIQNFTSLLDIPEPVDLAIVAVSRKAALQVLDDCVRKGVAIGHFFSAGFSETGTKEGRLLEKQLKEKAEKANFHLVGPNCMGLFNPGVGIKQVMEQYYGVSGTIGFISQSGGIAAAFSMDAYNQGIYINKSVSIGNGIMLDAADFLEYFGQDNQIKVIGMYVEGIKNGRRFFKSLRKVSAVKPVIIWKGGRTEEGGRAIASHTGSLALSQTVWNTAMKQCGAIQVRSEEELTNTLKAFVFLPDFRGDRLAIAGGSGGSSVTSADTFVEAGFKIPALAQNSYDELETFFGEVGGSFRNPIDNAGPIRRDMKRVIRILAEDENIDNLIYIVGTRPGKHILPMQLQNVMDNIRYFREISGKFVAAIVAIFNPDAAQESADVLKALQEAGIPVFSSYEYAATALMNVLEYNKRRSG